MSKDFEDRKAFNKSQSVIQDFPATTVACIGKSHLASFQIIVFFVCEEPKPTWN